MASRTALPRSFAEAMASLNGRDSRKLMHNTWAIYGKVDATDYVRIRLHNTNVVTFYSDGRVELDSGGWRTVTTKDRMNRCLPNGWRVWSDARKGGWGLYQNGQRMADYFDGIDVQGNQVTVYTCQS